MARHIAHIPIDPDRLALFLTQNESPTLEFKREWYKLEGDSTAAARQKDELVKDILALANGNAEVVGETSFLVIGAGDHREADGSRRVYDLGDSVPSPGQILDIVRAAASPPLAYLEVQPFQVGEARLFAVAIPPSPHIHETTRKLQTYSKYAVFIRKGDEVDLASEGEREVLRKLKGVLLAEATNPPATAFGALVGATIGGYLLARVGSKITRSKEGTIAGAIVGPIFGGLFGALIGSAHQLIKVAGREFLLASPTRRRVAIVASAPIAIATWYASEKVADFATRRLRSSVSKKDPGA